MLFEASAPGRLDVMGGVADYSGSLVLQMSIRQRTNVQISLRDDFICSLKSETSDGEKLSASLDYRTLLCNGEVDFSFARRALKESWVAYVIGCVLVLQKEKGIVFSGADFKIHSNVPLGKGVSSSASLEVATMNTLAKIFGLSFSGTELPILAQQVENRIVGAPCGLMDQLTCYFGEPGKLLPILCQPDQVGEPIHIPEEISFIGIDSGVRHSVGGASYSDVRCAAFMGYSIILNQLGVDPNDIVMARKINDVSKLPYGGYLCNISVDEFERKFKFHLPRTMIGKEFLSLFGSTIDHVTQVKENVTYAIQQCTSHPIYENQRVNNFMMILKTLTSDNIEKKCASLGELMYQSHVSYSRCDLGSERTDELVERMRNLHKEGIFGAKITGGGSGGTVCALVVGEKGKQSVKKIHTEFSKKYNSNLAIFE